MIHSIKKGVVVLSLLGLALLMLGSVTRAEAAATRFSLKLGGGFGYLLNGGGDLEKARKGYEAYAADWVEPEYTSAFDWDRLSFVPDLSFEAQIRFNGFGVGLGTGYIFATSQGGYDLFWDVTDVPAWWGYWDQSEDWLYDYTNKLTAIPISLNFYYYFPIDGIDLHVFAGPSVYFGSLKADNAYEHNYQYEDWYWPNHNFDMTGDYLYNETGTAELSNTAFGFQGGFGLEIPLSPMFSLGVEAAGRFVSFSNWEGTWSYSYRGRERWWFAGPGLFYDWSWTGSASGTGFLWNYDWFWNYMNKWYNELWVDDTAPSGSGLRNVQKASINLNSFGIRIHFVLHL